MALVVWACCGYAKYTHTADSPPLAGLAFNFAIGLSIENSDHLDDVGSITIKWAVTALAAVAAAFIVVCHRVVTTCLAGLKEKCTGKRRVGFEDSEEGE
jgi:hypothetical protein